MLTAWRRAVSMLAAGKARVSRQMRGQERVDYCPTRYLNANSCHPDRHCNSEPVASNETDARPHIHPQGVNSCRTAVRETWMRQAQSNDVMVRFILTEEERTPATDQV